jgi:hypothetical protein
LDKKIKRHHILTEEKPDDAGERLDRSTGKSLEN